MNNNQKQMELLRKETGEYLDTLCSDEYTNICSIIKEDRTGTMKDRFIDEIITKLLADNDSVLEDIVCEIEQSFYYH